MREVDTVHDSVYQFIKPKYITPDTIYKIWDICRNPDTKIILTFQLMMLICLWILQLVEQWLKNCHLYQVMTMKNA